MVGDKDNKVPSSSHTVNLLYALASQDGPGTVITHVVLKGPNYEEWAKGFQVSLGAKRKLGFINGTLKQPADDSVDLDDWWTTNYMVVAWIFKTIERGVRSTISYRDTARELWEDIRQRFSLGNGVKIYQLKSEISECKQRTGESIMDYYGRLKKLWDDVNDFDAIPNCTCSGYKCGLNALLRKRREADTVREFLMGLENYYATVRSNILGIDPLPSLHTVYSRLVQEEEVRVLTQPKSEAGTHMAYVVRHGQTSKTTGGSRLLLKCTYCTKNGNLEDRCWEKHGFPEGRGPRRQEKRIGEVPFTSTASGSSTSTSMIKTNVLFGEQSANTVRLNGKNGFTWIVDTGASAHVCCDENIFDDCYSTTPIKVGLPNGASLEATKVGAVKINNSLMLYKVLCYLFQCSTAIYYPFLSCYRLNN
ncbi:hypothetical protein vseg_001722 [Gypsophila vaccaria]